MKKLLQSIVIATVCTGLLAACNRQRTEVLPSYEMGSANATVNGKAISSTNCLGTPGSPVSIISASFSNNAEIIFNLKADLKAMTYTLDSSGADNNVAYTYGGVTVLSRSGTMTITAVNPGVNYTGTFNFTCVDGTQLTGAFTAAEVR